MCPGRVFITREHVGSLAWQGETGVARVFQWLLCKCPSGAVSIRLDTEYGNRGPNQHRAICVVSCEPLGVLRRFSGEARQHPAGMRIMSEHNFGRTNSPLTAETDFASANVQIEL